MHSFCRSPFGQILAGIALGIIQPPAFARSPPVDFARDVQPILAAKCLGCHGLDAKLGGLDLRSRAGALKGGTHGPALVPGKAGASRMLQMILGVQSPKMPPVGSLKPAEVVTLRKWIDAGARYDADILSGAKQVWWSFKAPTLPAVPALKNAWVRNPIDAFVLDGLRKSSLAPNSPASRTVLIRRAYMDLVGLPPNPQEVRAFCADSSPKAWEGVVDRLLSSPHYGERWARHWLDVVRYADSGGFEGDKDRPLAYKYRDYIIRAFNSDKPFTQFIREQLAGDEIAPENPDAIIATGYLACGPQDIVMQNDKNRADELDDLVSTTGVAFLGLTVGCARCHDHKYDPVKQTDYYRLQAIFAPSERREMSVAEASLRTAALEQSRIVDAELAPLLVRMQPLRDRGTALAVKAGTAKPTDDQIAAALPEADRPEFARLRAAIAEVEKQRIALPSAMAVTDKGKTFGASYLLIRGDAGHKGQEVQPGFVCSLPGGEAVVPVEAATAATTGRRKMLADWIASPSNPLTARVWMNRVWRQHFGRGIVGTPSNFGLNGETPTHPELLDWLALKFQKFGWQTKPMHRLMLLSSTYQQSSAIRPAAIKQDPLNKMLWRMPVRRLEGEVIRDSLLAVAGTLNTAQFGPAVYPPVDPTLRADTFQGINWPEAEDSPATWRRSIYVKVKRSLLFPQLEVFDCPEITNSVAARNVTTTPLQALSLLNDPLVYRQCGLFAERVRREVGNAPLKQIDHGYWLAFGRPPSDREKNISLGFLKSRSLADWCHALINLNEFVYVP